MHDQDILTAFYWLAAILGILIVGLIAAIIIGIKTSHNKLGDHCMKDCEGFDNGKVWLYMPDLHKKKK